MRGFSPFFSTNFFQPSPGHQSTLHLGQSWTWLDRLATPQSWAGDQGDFWDPWSFEGFLKFQPKPKQCTFFFRGNPSKLPRICCLLDPPQNGWFNDPCDTVATSRKWVPYQDKDTSLTGHLPLNKLELFEGETFWCHHPSFILLVDTPPGSASTNSGSTRKVHVGGCALSKVLNQNVRGQNMQKK